MPEAWNGIFALSGPGVRRGVDLGRLSLLDVAPTLAYLLDVPVAEDLDGRVIEGAFRPHHLKHRPIETVPSWESMD